VECFFHETVIANDRYPKPSIPTVLDAAHLVSIAHHDVVVPGYALWEGETISYGISEVMGRLGLAIQDYGILRPPIPNIESSAQKKARKSKEKTSRAARQALFKTALDGLATYRPPAPEPSPEWRERRV
jgi:hypothetical protein